MAEKAIAQTKVCTKCGVEKPLPEYNRDKRGLHGREARCRECAKAYKAWYRQAHAEKFRSGMREWRLKNLERERLRSREYARANAAQNKKRAKAWREANPERFAENSARWREANPEKFIEMRRKSAAKCGALPKRRLEVAMGQAMRRAFRNGGKPARTFQMLGYSPADLVAHLESQFVPGMTWENYGSHWHVDHIIPLSVFNYSSPDHGDFRRAWSLQNLQPLWADQNRRKHAKLSAPFQPGLEL